MRLFRVVPSVAAFVAVLAATVGCGGGKLRLELNPEPGTKYEITTSVDTASQQTVMGTETESTQTMRMVQEMVFEPAADGDSFSVVTTIASVSVEMTTDVGGKTIDTAEALSAPLDAMLAAFAGRSFTMTMSKRGQVTAVSGIDELHAGILDAVDLRTPWGRRCRPQ